MLAYGTSCSWGGMTEQVEVLSINNNKNDLDTRCNSTYAARHNACCQQQTCVSVTLEPHQLLSTTILTSGVAENVDLQPDNGVNAFSRCAKALAQTLNTDNYRRVHA